jgi:hypothetical protein
MSYGLDGSDQVLVLVLAVVTVGLLFWPLERRVASVSIYFLAGQSVLSYLVAGVAKIPGPLWKEGLAVQLILSTRTYGTPWFGRLLWDHPYLGRAVTWGVVVWEVLFPAAMLHPGTAVAALALGVGFHLATAFTMGLNTFVWAFLATYPAILYVAVV